MPAPNCERRRPRLPTTSDPFPVHGIPDMNSSCRRHVGFTGDACVVAPRSAAPPRNPATWLLAAAFVPGLVAYFSSLWNLEHYQFFPFALAGAARLSGRERSKSRSRRVSRRPSLGGDLTFKPRSLDGLRVVRLAVGDVRRRSDGPGRRVVRGGRKVERRPLHAVAGHAARHPAAAAEPRPRGD